MLCFGCQPPFDIDQEREAIIKVIEAETEAFANFDFETLASMHLQDSTNYRLSAGCDDYLSLQGWENVSAYLKNAIEGEKSPQNRDVHFEKTNYRFKIYPECALVFFDERWVFNYPDDTVEINSIQVRFLEKIDGAWKISFISFIGTSGYEELSGDEEFIEVLGGHQVPGEKVK
jgi:hypothetical protein